METSIMESTRLNLELVGVVDCEWLFEFLIEEVDHHYTMNNEDRYAMNSDGLWFFRRNEDHDYEMFKVLKE